MPDGARLLYIDDDPALCRLVQKALTRSGYSVETVGDGRAGVARVAQGGVDIVAVDHYMPGQDGLATLKAITRLADAPPVVYVTGAKEGRIAVAALQAGAANYVVKDTDEEFFELLRAALEGALSAGANRKAKEHAEAEVRAARDRFEALARQRALLLKEVDHRVGNSLQLIASMLHLQAATTKTEETKAALNRASQRVRAVAQVHKRLYTSADVRSVALDQYLQTLIRDLSDSYESGESRLSTADLARVYVSPDRAVAIGVITTELVINAQKHAYPNGAGIGTVCVSLAADGSDYLLSVEDQGVGRQQDPARPTGLGTLIIDAMTTKLGGRFWYDTTAEGTRACLRFSSDVAASGEREAGGPDIGESATAVPRRAAASRSAAGN